jgi:hypothetical protein
VSNYGGLRIVITMNYTSALYQMKSIVLGSLKKSIHVLWSLASMYPDQNYPLAVQIVLVVPLFGNYLSSIMILISNTISRFVLFGTVNGEIMYLKYFKIEAMLVYFLIVDLYGYVIVIIAVLFLLRIIKFLYSLSFSLCYIFVFICSIKMSTTVKKSFTNRPGLSERDGMVRREVVRAFLYQASVPLIFQIPQFLTQILQMLAFAFKLNLNADPWISVNAVNSS